MFYNVENEIVKEKKKKQKELQEACEILLFLLRSGQKLELTQSPVPTGSPSSPQAVFQSMYVQSLQDPAFGSLKMPTVSLQHLLRIFKLLQATP